MKRGGLIVYGLWFIVHRPWTMDYGLWSIVKEGRGVDNKI